MKQQKRNLQKEMDLVREMLHLYCKKHHTDSPLCEDCEKLLTDIKIRNERCPHGENKPFCSLCEIHCYHPITREKVIRVMRYAGPRMLFFHPVMVLKHAFSTLIKKQERLKND